MGAIENIRVADLTVGQFAKLMSDVMAENMPAKPDEVVKREDYTEGYVYGISGIARLLGRSRTYTQRIKSSGLLDPAIKQRGRTIICDAKLALELFANSKTRK